MKKRIRLKSVAELAEVSLSTASMILNRKEGVSFAAETVSRVMLAAQTLGYDQPLTMQNQETAEKKKVIAVFLPSATGNYYSAISHAVNCAAHKKGYDTIIFEAYRDSERELRGLTFLSSLPISGIVFTYIPYHSEIIEKISQTIPVVVIGTLNSFVKVVMIETVNYRGGVLMARHMLELGHRHVAFLATDRNWWGYPSTQRIQGVRETFHKEYPDAKLTERIQPMSSSLTQDSKFHSVKIGSQLAESCLDDKSITGFIAVNDYLAYGVLDALARQGYSVPQDFSVCGCDDIFPSSLIQVNLTTVNHHVDEKGESAFDLLYRRMTKSQLDEEEKGKPMEILRMEYLSSLVIRGTTARPAPLSKQKQHHPYITGTR